MVRKLAVALFAATSLSASIAQALGLGEVTVNSSLNQPLDAQIELVNTAGLEPTDIVTALASSEAFSRAKIDKSFFLTNVRFKVEWKDTGSAVIRMTSSKPVREPYLNFLIEVNWPSGRLLREYALLIDPPTYSLDDTTASSPVQTAASQAADQKKTQPDDNPKAAADKPASSPSNPPGNSAAPASAASPSSYGPIRSDETMWQIALKTRPDNSVSPQQMMLAIQDLNPGAFLNNNINLVKRGQTLTIPDEQSILERDRRAADSEFAEQNRAFESADDNAPGKPGEQMRILADEKGSAVGSETNSGEGSRAGSSLRAEKDSDLLEENLDEQTRANEELTNRLAAVEDQLRTAERLVKLKDDQLASLQSQLAGNQPDAATEDSTNASPQSAPDQGDADSAQPSAEDTDGEPTFTDENPAGVAAANSANQLDESGENNGAADDTNAGSAVDEPDNSADSSSDSTGDDASAADADQTDEVAADDDASAADAGAVASDADAEQPRLVEEKPVVKTRPQQATADADSESFLDVIASNPMYQIALAAGALLLLLLLWALSRRNASREIHYYEEPEGGEAYEGPSKAVVAASRAGLSGAAAAAAADETDPVAAAEVYLAYDREDQARKVLEDAIAEAPDNQRYRVKLMEVLGIAGDTVAMQVCYDEIMRGENEDAIVDAQALMSRYGDGDSEHAAEEIDLDRNELAAFDSTSDRDFSGETEGGALSDSDLDDVFGSSDSGSSDSGSSDRDLDSDSDLSFDVEPVDTAASVTKSGSPLALATQDIEKDEDSFQSLLEDDGEIEAGSTGEISFELDEDELHDMELDSEDFIDPELEQSDLDSIEEVQPAAEDSADDELDIDFTVADLDLDGATGTTADSRDMDADLLDLASLDSVDGDRVERGTDSSLDRSLQDAEAAANEINDSLQDPVELDFEEGSLELDELPNPVTEPDDGDIELDRLDQAEALDELDEGESDLDGPNAGIAAADAGEAADLDEDFDFLSDTDEAATKLDLARAYLDMGDKDGARDILLEVVDEGNSDQKTEANELLEGL